jgi:uncharacterized protein (DUF362 family)
MVKKSTVYILDHAEFSARRFREVIEVLELAEPLQQAKTVIIKPNLAAGTVHKSGSAVVTNRDTLEKLISFITEFNPDCVIKIVESDSTGEGYAFQKFFHNGYDVLTERFPNVQLIDLTRDEYECIRLNGLFFKRLGVPVTLLDYDFFITMSRIKTNTNTVITGALKNQFGCLPSGQKKYYHPYLTPIIMDINKLLKPDLSFTESNPAMEGVGPVHGSEKESSVMLMGNDPVATDAVMAEFMGFDPHKIAHIRAASQYGLGEVDLSKIALYGQQLDGVREQFHFIPRQRQWLVQGGFLIQRLGLRINHVGDVVHTQPSFWAVVRWLLQAGISRLIH